LNATTSRTNWTKEDISEIYHTPLIELQYAAVRTSNKNAPILSRHATCKRCPY
jgi:hypothetical protein